VAGLAAPANPPFLDLMAHAQRQRRIRRGRLGVPARWGSFLVPLFDWFLMRRDFMRRKNQNWTFLLYLGIGVVAWL